MSCLEVSTTFASYFRGARLNSGSEIRSWPRSSSVFPHFLQANAVVHCHYCIWEQYCQFQTVLNQIALGNSVGDIVTNGQTKNGTQYLLCKTMVLYYLKSGQDTSFHILSNPLFTRHSTMLYYTP